MSSGSDMSREQQMQMNNGLLGTLERYSVRTNWSWKDSRLWVWKRWTNGHRCLWIWGAIGKKEKQKKIVLAAKPLEWLTEID